MYVMLLSSELQIVWHSWPSRSHVYGTMLWDHYRNPAHQRAAQQAVAAAVQFGDSHAALVSVSLIDDEFSAIIRAFGVNTIPGVKAVVLAVRLPDEIHLLTNRELEVLRLTAGGVSTEDAAQRLGISKATVNTHRARARQKLGIKTMSELFEMGLRLNLTNDEYYARRSVIA